MRSPLVTHTAIGFLETFAPCSQFGRTLYTKLYHFLALPQSSRRIEMEENIRMEKTGAQGRD